MGAEDRIIKPRGFDGPVGERKITDPLCLLLLLTSWGAMTCLGIWAFDQGDLHNLVEQKDYMGRSCGVDLDQHGVVLPPKRAIVDVFLNGKCVDSCPNATDTDTLICKDDETIANLTGCALGTLSGNTDLLVLCGACMYSVDSHDVLSYCVPKQVNSVAEKINATLYSYFDDPEEAAAVDLPDYSKVDQTLIYVEKFLKDLQVTWRAVFGIGAGGAILFGFLFLFVARIPCVMAMCFWTVAICIPIIFAVLGEFFLSLKITETLIEENPELFEMTETGNDSDSFQKSAKVAGYIFYVCAGLAFLLLCFLRKRINLAIAITKAAAHSVAAVPLSVFYPILQMLGWCTFMVPWTVYFLHLASIGTKVEKTVTFMDFAIPYSTFEYDQNTQYGFWYLLFCLFWTSQFIIAIGQIVLAMCYSKWYFTVDKDGEINTSIFSATGVTLCKHGGTAAFGSLIIAIIQMVRAFVEYTQKKIEQAGPDSKIAGAAVCCCRCCLACLERCMKFISKNAYIQTAIFGHSFCKGAQEAFFLVLRNAARMSAVGLVSEVTQILCKVFTVLLCSCVTFYYIENYYMEDVSSVGGLCLFVALIAWFFADMFTDVLGIAETTIIQCFIADEEMHSGSGSVYVPEELDNFLKNLDADLGRDNSNEEQRPLYANPGTASYT